MKKYFYLYLIVAYSFVCQGQENNSKTFFEGVESNIITSKYVKEDYKIYVGFPFGYKKDKEYQVLYVLDANGSFGMVNDIVKLLSIEGNPRVIVVGVAYPTFIDWFNKRGRDFMPNFSDNSLDQYVSKFHQFISLELVPHINKKYKTKSSENILYGHSSGGVYGLYSLFKAPDVFKNYILTSPSVDEDSSFISNLEKKYYSMSKALNVNLYTSIGSKEKESFNKVYAQFVEVLRERKYKGLHITNDNVLGTHMSSMAQAFINGFDFINKNKLKNTKPQH